MTALTAPISRPVILPPGGLKTRSIPLVGYTDYSGGSTAHTVYKGALVGCDVTDADGYFGMVYGTPNTGDVFGGIALETQAVTSSDTANGAVSVLVAGNGIWGFPLNSLSITDIGAIVYTSDGNALGTSSSSTLAVGIVVAVDASYLWVNIAPYWMKPK